LIDHFRELWGDWTVSQKVCGADSTEERIAEAVVRRQNLVIKIQNRPREFDVGKESQTVMADAGNDF
jgi:hypothetical protein